MNRALALIGGVGLGAGIVYLLDPQQGRRRRAIIRDKAYSAMNEMEDAAEVIARDLSNRTRGIIAEVQGGGRPGRQQLDLLQDRWAPATRFLVGSTGLALLGFGLTQKAPQACVLGTIGLGLLARSVLNQGVRELVGQIRVPEAVNSLKDQIGDNWQRVQSSLGIGRQQGSREMATV